MSNPAFNEKTLARFRDVTDSAPMTIDGTINRAGLLILLTIGGAVIGWGQNSMPLLIGAILVGFICSLLIIFKPERAPTLSSVYAVAEGLVLGSISASMSIRFPGIVTNALMLTLSCLVLMLGLYKFKIITVTEKLRSVVIAATAAIAVTYLISMVMGLFGSQIPMIHESSTIGIGFSVLVVGVAAFNLLLDFDMIERAQLQGSPKYMEWYGAFALLVTLVWLYLEIIRLLGKIQKK